MKKILGSILFALCLVVPDECGGQPAYAQAPAPAADISIPEWRLMSVPATPTSPALTLACFTQEDVRQILRVQEQARYASRLVDLHLTLETRTQALITELQASQTEYAALRAVITERNERLSEEVLAAQATAERYRTRLERRRIWPWVALGFGAVAGAALGVGVAR